jgi:predicted nucleic acid-binding protein
MTALVFVDTNVFVYARQVREAHKQPIASQWIERLWHEQLGRVSMQVLNECYVTLIRQTKPAPAQTVVWDYVRSLLAWNPQPTNAELLHRAFEIEQRHHLNWWDCLIVGAAQLQGCALLLTEDLKDRAIYGGVTVRNPFSLGASEDLAGYDFVRAAHPAHPRRGRPRRARRAA